MNLPYNEEEAWQPVYLEQNKVNVVVGFLTKFTTARMALMTVRGAGHEVPAYKPDVAYDMWEKFLSGELTTSND